jgi:hypothetical protein
VDITGIDNDTRWADRAEQNHLWRLRNHLDS